MQKYTFVFAEHEEYGTNGLRLKNRPWFDPLDQVAVAHDMLEHLPDDRGTVEEEFMALGASIFVRDGDNWYRARAHGADDAYKNIAAEFRDQHRYLEEQNQKRLRWPGISHPIRSDEEAEDIIQATVCEARTYLPTEVGMDHVPEWLRHDDVIGWMRKGYRRARKRYAGLSAWQMLNFYQQVEREVQRYLEHWPRIGETVEITIDPRKRICKVKREDDDYDF